MASALPVIVGGVALLLLMGGKKKGEAAPVLPPGATEPPPPPKGSTAGPKGSSASKETWKRRQNALAYVNGYGLCSCSPGKIDGIYGSATKRAVKAFQAYAKIGVDGLWGSKTEAAMNKTIKGIVDGIIKKVTSGIPQEEPGGTASGAGGGATTAGVKKVSGKAASSGLWASTNGMEYDIGVQWRYTVLEPFLKSKWDEYKVAEASRSEFGGFGFRYEGDWSLEQMGHVWDHIFDSSEPHYLAIKSMILDIMKVSVGGVEKPLRYVPMPAQRKIRDTIYGWLQIWTKSKINSSFADTWRDEDL